MSRLGPVLFVGLCLGVFVDARLIKVIANDEQVEIDIEDNAGREDDDVQVTADCGACQESRCRRPHCRCSGSDIPGGLPASHTPQMIIFSYTNAIRPQDMHLYEELFQNRTNPNHCPVSATFFVSGNWTWYSKVNQLYSEGHEIGDNGVNEETLAYWQKGSYNDWYEQMSDMKKILSTFAAVNPNDIRGWRTPFLYMGGDVMMRALVSAGLKYDSTRVSLNGPHRPNTIWPFTYDYMSTSDCPIGKPPKDCFPGVWEMPIQALALPPSGAPCADLQGCTDVVNETDAYNILYDAFQDRYKGSRTPMVVQMKVEYLMSPEKMRGTKRFLDAIKNYGDVYVVSAWRASQWVQQPQCVHCNPAAFRCDTPPPKPCTNPASCQYDAARKLVPGGGGVYVTTVCSARCPPCYPALHDPYGTKC